MFTFKRNNQTTNATPKIQHVSWNEILQFAWDHPYAPTTYIAMWGYFRKLGESYESAEYLACNSCAKNGAIRPINQLDPRVNLDRIYQLEREIEAKILQNSRF